MLSISERQYQICMQHLLLESLIDYVCKIILGAHRGPLPINFGSVIRDIEDEHRKIIFIQCILASVNHNHLSSRADHAWSMKIDVTSIQNIITVTLPTQKNLMRLTTALTAWHCHSICLECCKMACSSASPAHLQSSHNARPI